MYPFRHINRNPDTNVCYIFYFSGIFCIFTYILFFISTYTSNINQINLAFNVGSQLSMTSLVLCILFDILFLILFFTLQSMTSFVLWTFPKRKLLILFLLYNQWRHLTGKGTLLGTGILTWSGNLTWNKTPKNFNCNPNPKAYYICYYGVFIVYLYTYTLLILTK